FPYTTLFRSRVSSLETDLEFANSPQFEIFEYKFSSQAIDRTRNVSGPFPIPGFEPRLDFVGVCFHDCRRVIHKLRFFIASKIVGEAYIKSYTGSREGRYFIDIFRQIRSKTIPDHRSR